MLEPILLAIYYNIFQIYEQQKKKNEIFHLECIFISRTTVISALRHKPKYMSKFNSDLFWKENPIFEFYAVVLVKTFPLMYQLLM